MNRFKFRLRYHLLKLSPRIGALQQHEPEGQLRNDGVHRAQTHLVYRLAHRSWRRIFPQINDQSAPTRLENPVHFPQRANRFRKILKCRPAEQEIERLIVERHVRCIAMPEIYFYSRLRRVLVSYFDERVADVETRDSEIGR